MQSDRKMAWLARVGFIICVLAMIFPAAWGANRIEPFVFGLPFLFFWYVLWVFLLFLGLLFFYLFDNRKAA